MEITSQEDKLEGWTKEEKFELLEAIREVGSCNVQLLNELVCNKTEDEIKAALDFYMKKAMDHPPTIHKRERRINLPMMPLSSWAKFIADTHGFNEFQTETDIALRLIAEFEDKPSAVMTEKIDFRKLYQVLAEALEGKPLPKDKYISPIIGKCIVETALTSKALNRGSACFKNILQSTCNPFEAAVNTFSKPSTDSELVTLRSISSRKNYNPLNIPENNLRFSTQSM